MNRVVLVEPLIGLERVVSLTVTTHEQVWRLASGTVSLFALSAQCLPDYDPEIPAEAMEKMGDPDKVQVLAILQRSRGNYPHTVNLRAPLLVNLDEELALQVILEDEELPLQLALPEGFLKD